jgi:hypothetical protein
MRSTRQPRRERNGNPRPMGIGGTRIGPSKSGGYCLLTFQMLPLPSSEK